MIPGQRTQLSTLANTNFVHTAQTGGDFFKQDYGPLSWFYLLGKQSSGAEVEAFVYTHFHCERRGSFYKRGLYNKLGILLKCMVKNKKGYVCRVVIKSHSYTNILF